MTDPEKEHLPVQIVHPADRACGEVGRERKRVGDDPACFRSGGREGLGVIAAQYIG
jgi:hypothetical protein